MAHPIGSPALLPAVVFLHHFGGSARTWTAVLPLLAGVCRCVAADLRGAGGRHGDGRPFDVAEDADEVVGRMAAMGMADVVVVGHSRGARVAVEVAAREPRRVRGVVLVAPSPPTPEPMDDAARATLRAARESRAAAERLVDSIVGERLPPDVRAMAVEDVLANDPAAWAAWVDVGSRRDITGITNAVGCPVAVLSGDRDKAVPTDVVRKEVVGRLPQARLTVVPGAGHLLPLERPAVVADAVKAMVGATTAAAVGMSLRDLLVSPLVTPVTRRVLEERAAWRPSGPAFLTADELVTLRAVCDTLIPQDDRGNDRAADRYRVDIAAEIDARLATGLGDGWRYATMPPDGEACRLGLAALDEVAAIGRGHGVRFRDLSPDDRHRVLADVRDGTGRPDAPWESRGLDPRRLLQDWVAEATEIYYSHVGGGVADMGYVGFADGRGWRRVGLDQLDRHDRETEAYHA